MKKIIVCFGLIMLFCIGATGTVRSEIVEDQNISSAVIFDSLLSESNVKSQIEDSMVKLKDLEDKCMTKDDAKNYMWKFCSLLIAVIFLVFAVLSICLFRVYKKLSKRIARNEENAHTSYCKMQSDNIDKITQLTYNKLEPIKVKIKEEVLHELKSTLKSESLLVSDKNNDISDVPENIQNQVLQENYKIIYARAMQNGCLKETSNSLEAQYIIRNVQGESKGRFKVSETQEQMQKAIKNKEDILDRFCEEEGSSVGAKSIGVLSLGEVERQEDGTWRVLKKSKIKFIK